MSTFLELLPLELKQVKDFIEPEEELKPKETIIGEMSDDHKRLYTLSRYMIKEALDLLASLAISVKDKESLLAKSRQLKTKVSILHELFWLEIKDDFDLWNTDGTIGVRQGFKVVVYKEEDRGEDPLDFIKKLLGG